MRLILLISCLLASHAFFLFPGSRIQSASPDSYHELRKTALMRGASKRSSLRAQEHLESRPIFSASAHADSHGEEGQVLDTLVVGGGISGCTAAFYLQQRGVNCLLAEARDELGGNIITRSAEGFLWEEGPNSFQPNAFILKLAQDVGMLDDLVLSNPSAPRYVYWGDKLHPLPSSLADVTRFELLSPGAMLRAAAGALGLGLAPPPPPAQDESVKDFFTRHLGPEVFSRIIDPFISGIYAGDPARLSMRSALGKIQSFEEGGWSQSIAEGVLRRALFPKPDAREREVAASLGPSAVPIPGGSLGSFRRGLQSLVNRIGEELGDVTVRLSHRLRSLRRGVGKEGVWEASFDTPQGEKIYRARSLLMTIPASAAADVLAPDTSTRSSTSTSSSSSTSRSSSASAPSSSSGSAAAAAVVVPEAGRLREVPYPCVASVTLAYPNDAFKVPIDGFGHLIPRELGIRTLGSVWSSALFPGRAPDGYSVILSYIGGAQDPGIRSLDKADIVKQVHSDLKRILLRPFAPEPLQLGVRVWDQAIPQYNRGHGALVAEVDSAVRRSCPGLFLGGSLRGGVAFGDCVRNGMLGADEVASYLMRKN